MLFYEIVAIVIGVIIIIGGILNLTKKSFNLPAAILLWVIGALYVGLGIGGFFIPKNYEWVYTSVLIALSIIAMISIRLVTKKD